MLCRRGAAPQCERALHCSARSLAVRPAPIRFPALRAHCQMCRRPCGRLGHDLHDGAASRGGRVVKTSETPAAVVRSCERKKERKQRTQGRDPCRFPSSVASFSSASSCGAAACRSLVLAASLSFRSSQLRPPRGVSWPLKSIELPSRKDHISGSECKICIETRHFTDQSKLVSLSATEQFRFAAIAD